MNKINDNIKSLDLGEEFAITVPNRNKESESWFQTAIYNYRTASILIGHNVFAHAIFFMQQCIECLIKGILIENNIVTSSNLKKWSHKPEKAIELFLSRESSPSAENYNYIKTKLNETTNIEEKFTLALKIINVCTSETEQNIKRNPLGRNIYLHTCIDSHLYTLAILLYSTQQNTRYPDDNFKSPMRTYDESKTIQSMAIELMKCIKYAIWMIVGCNNI